jgi:protein-tyrosine phosphatase
MSGTHPRVLPLQGASNFRDLGGYLGHQGRPVRWRLLFRSDHPAHLTPQDHAVLEEVGITRALDFRGEAERAAAAYEIPGAAHHALSIEPAVVQRMQDLQRLSRPMTAAVMVDLMRELYRGLVNDQAHRFAELFDHLLQAEGPLLFHCTAGKDRTGLAAAFILAALGVSRDDIRRDYLLTNEHFRPPVRAPRRATEPADGRSLPDDALAVLWRVEEGFLDAALETIDADHGGMALYLARRLGLTAAARKTLERKYLSA